MIYRYFNSFVSFVWRVIKYSFKSSVLLVGILVLEQQLITPSYTTGLILGFLGISVLKIQITLFKPLTGSEGLTAKFDQVFGGIQQFCFDVRSFPTTMQP